MQELMKEVLPILRAINVIVSIAISKFIKQLLRYYKAEPNIGKAACNMLIYDELRRRHPFPHSQW